ncbi:MAG: hypothetical protein WCG91_03530 [Candidatus Shapirobacteria bacterium]
MIAGIFGTVQNPTKYISVDGSGLFIFINNILKFTAVIAGLFLVFQIITAGYIYISANGDPKKTEQAWAKIWQAILGFIIVAAAFVIAAVIGKITGTNPLTPTIYGPQ